MNTFYTYAYLREDGTPYYIGKGIRDRINSNQHSVNLPPPERRIYLKQNLTEDEAFRHEMYMISVLGRKDNGTGILRNLTRGGEGGAGQVCGAHQKEIMSQKHSGANNPMYGLTGEKNPFYGKTHSEETKRKISEAKKKQYREKDHPWIGRKHSEETKRKISETKRRAT